MGVLIDSDILISAERERLSFADYISAHEEEEAFISVITASELLHGIHRATDATVRVRRHSFVEGILTAIPVLSIDISIARIHAELWADLSQTGEMIGIHDLWLASTCLAYSLRLMTRNTREFSCIPGLEICLNGCF